MAGSASRGRRLAFLAALIVSASLYAYSLAGIAGAGGNLPFAPIAEKQGERSAPVVYDGCPGEREDAVRL